MFEKLKSMFEEKNKKRKTENLIAFLIILIITLIIVNKIINDKDINSIEKSSNVELVSGIDEKIESSNKIELEERLEECLSNISGVGKVDVLLTYSETESILPLYNENISESISTTEKGEKTETKTESKEVFTDSQNEAVLQKRYYPKIEGAIVIAEGAGNSEVKANIIYAVEAVTGLLTHKIQVFKMK